MLLVYFLAYVPFQYLAAAFKLKTKSWFMPVLRKFGAHKSAVRNIKFAERYNAHHLISQRIFHNCLVQMPEGHETGLSGI